MTTATKRRARVQAKPERAKGEQAPPRSPLVSIWEWRARNAHLFPSDTSLRWHLRQFRDDYVAAGALFEVAGRHVCDPPKMEATLREVGSRVAAERAARREVGAA